jgi:HEAT repeat protein
VLVLVLASLPLGAVALAAATPPSGVTMGADVQALGDEKKEIRLAAVKRLGSYGASAILAAEQLGKMVQEDPDTQVANQAALALAKIGPAGARELAAAVRSEKTVVRHRALVALGKMGPAAKEALEALMDALEDADSPCRAWAAFALGEMGAAAAPAVDALCLALRDSNAEVRKQALLALANIGPESVPSLQKLLADEEAPVRYSAIQALTIQCTDAKEAASDLAKLLKDKEPALRSAAAAALAALGSVAKQAVPELLLAMKDDKIDVQQSAFRALLRVSADDSEGMLDAFRKLNEQHHWAAPYVLKQFGPKAKDAVKPLILRLQAKEDDERFAAALALGRIGKEAKEAIPALQKAMNDPNPKVKHSAAFALAYIQAAPPVEIDESLQDAFARIEKSLVLSQQKLQELQRAVENILPDLKPPARGDPVVKRPVNRQAFFDPKLQTFYATFIDIHIMFSAELNALSQNIDGGKQCPTVYLKQFFPKAAQSLFYANQKTIDSMGPEAIPALVRGINLAVSYNIGFT